MISYEALVRECLAHGVMPAVVPQLKTITLGGAVAGVGIESSSHRHGLVHDTMLELEVLLGDGRIVTATPDNEHADLFFGFPNSYGTLGYALRVLARDRATVALHLAGGGELVGTVDVVGADHLTLAEHPEGVPRRRENVRRLVTVPFTALLAVESRR